MWRWKKSSAPIKDCNSFLQTFTFKNCINLLFARWPCSITQITNILCLFEEMHTSTISHGFDAFGIWKFLCRHPGADQISFCTWSSIRISTFDKKAVWVWFVGWVARIFQPFLLPCFPFLSTRIGKIPGGGGSTNPSCTNSSTCASISARASLSHFSLY